MKKNILQSFRKTTILLLVLLLNACSGDLNVNVNKKEDLNNSPVKKFENKEIIKQVKELYNESIVKLSKANPALDANSFDFDNVKAVATENSDIIGIVIESDENYDNQDLKRYLFAYLENDVLVNGLIVNEIESEENNIFITKFKTLDNHLFLKMKVQNGNLLSYELPQEKGNRLSKPSNIYVIQKDFFGEFGDCFQGYFEYFVEGGFLGNAAGLACIAFGAECALAITSACIVQALKKMD